MRTRYGTSPWIHQFPASRVPQRPAFKGDLTADVVVVGGGLTGCVAAYTCASAGLRTVLLERDRLGQGASGRSAGFLSSEPGPSFRDLVGLHGVRAARTVFATWRRGALDGAALLRRLRVNCQLDSREMVIAASRDQEKALRREYDMRREAGLDAAWLNGRQVQQRLRLEAAAVKVRDGFVLDPYRASVGVMAAALRRGAACFERSPVSRIRFTRKHADVIVERGTIRAQKVIVAAGSATAEFKPLQRHFTRREKYLVLTEPVPAAMRREMGDAAIVLRDQQVPPHHVAWTRDQRLLLAGADQGEPPARTRPAVLVQRTGQLMYELLKQYPVISGLQPEYGWDAPYGETVDGLMYIGPHRNYPHHLFALGGDGAGVTGAFVAARMLLRSMQDGPDKRDEVFGWTR
jgi:glycine/D-amino acid oxidase-like deaminating enzyme